MSRAASTVLGALLLTAATLVLAAVAGVAVVESSPPAHAPEPVVLSANVLVDDDGTVVVVLVHEGGPDLDVHEIDVRISVGEDRLDRQPPVPFYSAPGYASFPSGPFNPVADPGWEVGERASLTITGENATPIVEGASVRIEIYREGLRIATVETVAH